MKSQKEDNGDLVAIKTDTKPEDVTQVDNEIHDGTVETDKGLQLSKQKEANNIKSNGHLKITDPLTNKIHNIISVVDKSKNENSQSNFHSSSLLTAKSKVDIEGSQHCSNEIVDATISTCISKLGNKTTIEGTATEIKKNAVQMISSSDDVGKDGIMSNSKRDIELK